jgi:hypothetical protein
MKDGSVGDASVAMGIKTTALVCVCGPARGVVFFDDSNRPKGGHDGLPSPSLWLALPLPHGFTLV